MGIPITRPLMGEAERAAILEPLESGWLMQGPKVEAFEKSVAAFAGLPHAVATSSGTTALHLALLLAGVGPGDEVILPSFTFVATANAVVYTGAKPVLVDIDLETFALDPGAVEAAISPRTRAIIPVHLFGLMADMPSLTQLAHRHGLAIIEDAACALGSGFLGSHPGHFGNCACLSFHPRKIITTGEGGMILTRDGELAARARILRDHGAQMPKREAHESQGVLLPDFDELGYNYRMTDLQAAVGVAQITRLEAILVERRRLATRYREALGDMPHLHQPLIPEGYAHAFQAYVCLLCDRAHPSGGDPARLKQKRDALMARLSLRGIATRPGTHAIHLLGYYRKTYGYDAGVCMFATHADHASIALPLYPGMTDTELEYVVHSLRLELGGP